MRHPALRRSARHTSRREARAESVKSSVQPDIAAIDSTQTAPATSNDEPSHDPAGQNRPVPGVPPDGDHNQGGVRKEGIDYQRDLGSEQDA